MTSTILLSSPMFLFLGKMFICAFFGIILLGALRLAVDLMQNPKGWKFGNELYDDKEDKAQNTREMKLNYRLVKTDDETLPGINRRQKAD